MHLYRIEEGRVSVCNGYTCWIERRFIAKRKIRLFGLFTIWWFLPDGEWRKTLDEAKADADRDAEIRLPLSKPNMYSAKGF